MNGFKSHLRFSNNQRGGIFALLALIAVLLFFLNFFKFSSEENLDLTSTEVVALQKQIDSIRIVALENRKPKRYPFNPNYITDYKGYTLGLTPEEIDRLLKFRSEDKWVNSAKDFQNVTKVSDSLLAEISLFFKFPDWVNNPKPERQAYVSYDKKKFNGIKIDLNKATKEELMAVNGIGEARSTYIIEYREKLSGFSNDAQLIGVYGLEPLVIEKILERFTVQNPKSIQKINVNKASASDIATITGINFYLAKKIWEYRKVRGGITDLQQLENVQGITAKKLDGIKLYLSTE